MKIEKFLGDFQHLEKENVILNEKSTLFSEYKPGIQYETIAKAMKTFDMLLFHGGEGISNFIAKNQAALYGQGKVGNGLTDDEKDAASKVSHVG